MLRFRRLRSLQKFASVHASVTNHFNTERSLSSRPLFKANRTAAGGRARSVRANPSTVNAGSAFKSRRIATAGVLNLFIAAPQNSISVRRLRQQSTQIEPMADLTLSRHRSGPWLFTPRPHDDAPHSCQILHVTDRGHPEV